jgi:hypothetical protein
VTKLCKLYLKGKCNKGDDCNYHHHGPCNFFAKGTCERGDDCIYGHSVQPAAAAVEPSTAAAKKAAKEGTDKDNA